MEECNGDKEYWNGMLQMRNDRNEMMKIKNK